MEQTPTTAPPTPTVLLGNGVGSIRRRPPTISVPTPVPFLPPPAPNAAGTTISYHHNSNNKQLPAKSPALDSLANSGNMGTGSSHGGAAAANAAMQFLCDDMLHTLNKAIDQHNRRERQSSIPSGMVGGVITSPETTPQRGGGSGSAGGGGGVASIMLPLTSTTTTSAGNPAPQQMLQFSTLQPPTISTTFASCPRISSEDVIGSFARQGTTTPPPAGCSSAPTPLLQQQQTPSSAGTVMDSRHSTNIFEDAPPMSATMTSTVRSTCTATNATSNPLDPNSTSSSPTPAFTFPVTNSPSAVLRKKRAQLDATVAPQSSGTPQPPPPPPPPVQTLPYFDKGLLATALYAMDRSELSQLVLSMADILGYHAGRAGFHFGGMTAAMPTTTPTYGSSRWQTFWATTQVALDFISVG
ncbi:Hypothetical protein, putative [Bodo saltans]|uniref:Uncharacterized protein n=1 Tax=Bodo saltans TaxID=75058 RepID=A0A0S4JIM7_BODSA|nr:Hypothetical protein, putative [Bodo saltans]|eukprot:CUG90396.1 Hypothetical protein, putative [Bodo saltans]